MRRALGAAACAAMLVISAAGAAAADPAGAGSTRWTASYAFGSPAFTSAITLTPDGSTVLETGRSTFPGGHMSTVAFDAATGAQTWAAEYPASDDQFGSGFALSTSPDGETAYVAGYVECLHGCDSSSFEGWVVVAYDVATGDREWVARQAGVGGAPQSVQVTPDGSTVVAAFSDGDSGTQVIAYDTSDGHQLWAAAADKAVGYNGGAMSLSPDGSTAYVTEPAPSDGLNCFDTGGYDTTAYDTANGEVDWSNTYQLSDSNLCGVPTDLGVSPDGSTVFVTGYGGTGGAHGLYGSGTVAYDAATGDQTWAVNDDDIDVLPGDTKISLGVDPDGSQVIVAGDDCHAYPACPSSTLAYDSSTGARTWGSTYDGGGRGYTADVAVSPDGSAAYITGQSQLGSETDAPLVSYDLKTGAERWATTYPDNVGSAIAVSPDGGAVFLAGTFTSATGASRSSSRAGATACGDRCGYSATRFSAKPGPGRYQELQTSFRYDGWRGSFDKDAVGGAYRESNHHGATATFQSPSTTRLTWLTRVGPSQGRAKLVVDGRVRGTYNLYAAHSADRAVTLTGLAKKPHTVTVRVLGRKSAASHGTWVALDGFRYHHGIGFTDESSTRVRFDRWTGVTNAHASGGSMRQSGRRGASVSLDFTGRRLTWVTATGPSSGRARIEVDGRTRVVDLYRPRQHWKASVDIAHLARGEHHVTVTVLGRKDRASHGTTVVMDALVAHRH